MTSPLVSIMMPAYNAALYIETAIQSVIDQTYSNWELVVVDDGSTDNTAAIVTRIDDPRIRLIRQENGGEASARNTALDHIRGEYLGFLDSDDLFLPDHLTLTVTYLEDHPDQTAVYTDGFHIDSEGNRGQTLSSNRRGPFEGRIFEEIVRASDVFGPPICILARSISILDLNLRFDTRIVIGPDWDFWIRYADIAIFGFIEATTCLYRVHETNITVQVGQRRRAGYLALCREKAIQMPNFSSCPLDIRTAVFYDLLVNLRRGTPDSQLEVSTWPQFLALPAETRARLFGLMASKAIMADGEASFITSCLQKARELNPADRRGQTLAILYQLHPALSKYFLQLKSQLTTKQTEHSPFGEMV